MESIYCKKCSELGVRRGNPYCQKYKIVLRAVPMDDVTVKFAVKCLECIENENKTIAD